MSTPAILPPKEAPIGYFLDASLWRNLRRVEQDLYGDGRHLTPDKRRDLANLLTAVLFNAVPVGQDDIVPR